MSMITLIVVLFLTGLLTDMPKAVLASIVFLIGIGLIDIVGLKRIRAARASEFVIALLTAIVVFSVGVEQGIILAIVLSIIEIIRRAYSPKNFLVGINKDGAPSYTAATPGTESLPGLLVFRYDAELFYANASRFADDVLALIAAAPSKVRWLVLDCSAMVDVDYSASLTLAGLIDAVHADGGVFAIAAADPELLANLDKYGTLDRFHALHIYPSVLDAVTAFQLSASPAGPDPGSQPNGGS